MAFQAITRTPLKAMRKWFCPICRLVFRYDGRWTGECPTPSCPGSPRETL